MDYALWHAVKGGWFVLSILLCGSVISIAIIFDRIIALRRARMDAEKFARLLYRVLREQGRTAAIAFCGEHRQPIAEVMSAMISASGTREERERAFRHALRISVRSLQTRVPILGTVGSIAPFVGLFGTVWGIMKAFREIGANAGGGPSVVAAGISEALITTAFGLLVAIPAIVAYNSFTTHIRRLAEEIDLTTLEMLDEVMRMDEVRR